jgi:eukaryotic-like serine/threonine-protein kinase
VLFGHTDAVTAARFSPHGARVLTGSGDGTARVWMTSQGEIKLRGALVHSADVSFSPNGRRLLAVDPTGRAAVWNVQRNKGRQLQQKMPPLNIATPPCGRAVGCSPWSPDGQYIAGVDEGFRPTVWDARTGVARALGPMSLGAAFTHDARVFALGAQGATIVNPASGTTCAQVPIGSAARAQRFAAKTCARIRTTSIIDGVYFSRHGPIVTLADGRVQVWMGNGKSDGAALVGGGAQATAITGDGRRVAVGMRHTLDVYDLRKKARLVATAPVREITDVAWDRTGKRILTVSADRTARVWRSERLKRPTAVLRNPDWIITAGFSPDGRFVLTASRDSARLWDPELKATVLTVRKRALGGAGFSPDGRFIAVSGADGVDLQRCEVCAPFDELELLARSRLPAKN